MKVRTMIGSGKLIYSLLVFLFLLVQASTAEISTKVIDGDVKSCVLQQTERSSEKLNWQVISSGGTNAASQHYALLGTAGQTAVGFSSSQNYGVHHGFWQNAPCDCSPGDADGNGIHEITDAVYVISYVFVPGSPAPAPYPICSGDADCNCIVEISDAVYLINYVFVPGSPAPCGCETWGSTCSWPLRSPESQEIEHGIQ